jgi:ectoine hydroxylase-related dioxygenase (phytanoyl-CoA dioxygenase family)
MVNQERVANYLTKSGEVEYKEKALKFGLSDQQYEEFQTNGYLLLKNVTEVMPLIRLMQDEVRALGKQFMADYDDETSAEKIAALPPNRRKAFYHALRYLPSTTQLACSPLLLHISKQLKLMKPAVMHSYNLRMDMPNEPQFMFHWHQDITYLLGSKNSITYWVPLTPVNEHRGSIELIEGSHRQGLVPFHYTGEGAPPLHKSMSPRDICLDVEPTDDAKMIKAEPGDIVVFSQFLLHRSTPNYSNQIRWASQVRHSDLGEADFQEAGFPFGDCANIFHHDYLK